MLNRIAVQSRYGIRRTESGLQISLAGEGRTAGGLSRVMQWIESDRGFMTLTSFRKENSFAVNKASFSKLPAALRSMLGTKQVGAYWLIGHWTECTVKVPDGAASLVEGCRAAGGQLKDSLEYSWYFVQPETVDNKAWMHAAQKIAHQYEQDGFILRGNGEASAGLYSSAGEQWARLTTKDSIVEGWKRLAWMRAHSDIYGYSELKQMRDHGRLHPIVFTTQAESTGSYVVANCLEPEACPLPGYQAISFYAAKPHNISASQMFHYEGIEAGE